MLPHIRAIVAASAYAVITGRKVAGLYDHAADRHLRVAAECRGDWLQARDGERSVDFGGTLPDLYDQGDKAFVSLERDGAAVRGYDRGSATFYDARVAGDVVQFYDHGTNGWFAFTVQVV
ncbi:hypothetical protein [Sphingomonas sp. MMS24-J13]|uniref:hypothetical protein n=1 Tax=Sphingomonas sp. MMS24-J13 TaxID=3238686 RepID=UPI00384C4024